MPNPILTNVGVAASTHDVVGVVVIGDVALECTQLNYTLTPMYSDAMNMIYVGTRARIDAVCKTFKGLGGVDNGISSIDNINAAFVRLASPYGWADGAGKIMDASGGVYASALGSAESDADNPLSFADKPNTSWRKNEAMGAPFANNRKVSDLIQSGEYDKKHVYRLYGKNICVVFGGSPPNNLDNLEIVTPYLIPGWAILSPIIASVSAVPGSGDDFTFAVSVEFTFWHGPVNQLNNVAVMRIGVGASYGVGDVLKTIMTIFVRHLARHHQSEDAGNDRFLVGAVDYIPRGHPRTATITRMQAIPHDDGMGLTIMLEYTHDHMLFHFAAVPPSVLMVHVVENSAVVPPNAGWTMASEMASAQRSLQEIAQAQELFNWGMQISRGVMQTAAGAASLSPSGVASGVMGTVSSVGNTALTIMRQNEQRHLLNLQIAASTGTELVRSVNITVYGLPCAHVASLATVAARIANYMFLHWTRQVLVGKERSGMPTTNELVSKIANDVQSNSVLYGFFLGGILFGGASLVSQSVLRHKIEEMLRNKGFHHTALQIASIALAYGGAASSAEAYAMALKYLLGSFGVKRISSSSVFDHLTKVYNVKVNVSYSDEHVFGFPAFLNASVANLIMKSVFLSEIGEVTITKPPDAVKGLIMSVASFIPAPVSLGYNTYGGATGGENMFGVFIEDAGKRHIVANELAAKLSTAGTVTNILPIFEHTNGGRVGTIERVKPDIDRNAFYNNSRSNRAKKVCTVLGHTGYTTTHYVTSIVGENGDVSTWKPPVVLDKNFAARVGALHMAPSSELAHIVMSD